MESNERINGVDDYRIQLKRQLQGMPNTGIRI